MKNRPKQTKEMLEKASKAIAHEIKSLRMASEVHEQYRAEGGHPVIVMNSLVITFAISYRNILDFMFSGRNERPPKSNDVIAEDFFDSNQEWLDAIWACPENALASRRKLNKQIAHLTYEQFNISPEDARWDIDGMINDLSPAIEAFYRRVHYDYFLDIRAELKNPVWYGRVRTPLYA